MVIALPLTGKGEAKAAGFESHRILVPAEYVIHYPGNGQPLDREPLALTEQIRALDASRLPQKPVARLNPTGLAMVEAGLRFVLQIP